MREIENQKKQAALDEDFEKALECKKMIQKTSVEIEVKKGLLKELLSTDIGGRITDKQVLQAVLSHEEGSSGGKFVLTHLLTQKQAS